MQKYELLPEKTKMRPDGVRLQKQRHPPSTVIPDLDPKPCATIRHPETSKQASPKPQSKPIGN